MMHVGDIVSIVGMFSIVGDIMIYVGDIMSTVGENLLLFEYPHGTEHPHGTHDIPSHVS